jgi:tetratricopeptide (TPR) repeat protein
MFARRGTIWHNKQEYDKAIADENEAIRLNPRNTLAYHNRARAWREKKDYDKSLADFDQALELRNPSEKTLVLGDAELTLGAESNQMINMGSLILSERGRTWTAKRDYEKAIEDYTEAIRLDPNYQGPFRLRRRVWEKQGEWPKAVAELEGIIKAGSPPASIENEYARLRATCPLDKFRDGREAVKHATIACESGKWKIAIFLDTLAAAYAETGDFDKAIESEQKALAVADAKTAGDFTARMKLYQGRQPYHQ